MRCKKILSFILFLLGVVFILNSSSSITGYIIFKGLSKTLSSFLGVFLIVLGLMLNIYEAERERQRRGVDYIISQYESGRIDPVEAAERINGLRGGKFVEGVRYSKGKGSVFTKIGKIDLTDLKPSKALNLALALKEVALINDKRNKVNCYLEGIPKKSMETFEEVYKNKLEKIVKKS